MESDEKILENSPILYIQSKQKLYKGLLKKNYTEEQVRRLFSELYKYNIKYFYSIATKEELDRLNGLPVSADQKEHASDDTVHSLEEMVEENEISKKNITVELEELEQCILSVGSIYVKRCFDTYHMRDRSHLYIAKDAKEFNQFDGLFLHAYCKYLSGEYLSTREGIESLLRKSSLGGSVHFGCRLHLLSLGAAASYKSGGYYDAVWLAKAGKMLSESVEFVKGVEYFENMLIVIETARKAKGLTHVHQYTLLSAQVEAQLSIPITLEDKINRCIQYGNEITLLRDVKIYDSREIHANKMEDSSILGYIAKIKGISEKCKRISPIIVYSIDGCIAFGLIYYNEKPKMSVIKSKISVEHILSRLSGIQLRNKEVLKRVCNTAEEKKEWWKSRISLDAEIKREIVSIDTYLQKYVKKGHEIKKRVALVIEDVLGSIPFEMCNTFINSGVFRSSSLSHILSCNDAPTSLDPVMDTDIFYILNPEKNLVQTEERILEYIRHHIPNATGIKNRPPLPMEAEQAILSHRIFMYFGHGGGEKFFAPRKLKRITEGSTEVRTKSIFLFGCSSAKVSGFSMYNTHSTCISYMHIPIVKNVVGALWDVTDKDLDITSIGIMNTIKYRKESLSVALNRLKRECKLKYLNGAAIVLYGIDE